MGDGTPSKITSERQKWQKIFLALVKELQSQQHQLQLLQDLHETQRDRWVSDVQILETELARVKRESSLAEMGHYLEMGKSQLLDSLKNSKSQIFKLKLEHAVDDLEDLRSCYDHVTHKLLEYEVAGDKTEKSSQGKHGKSLEIAVGGSRSLEEQQHSMNVEDEIIKLKLAYESLILKNKAEVSALLSEKNFVWKQFTSMEKECTNLRRSKQGELEQANEKIHNFLTSMEQLQLLNSEKDETILKLKDDLAKAEADTENKNRELSRLRKELEVLKNSRGAPQTPVLNSCTTRTRAANMDRQKNSRDRRLALKQESPFSQVVGFSKQSEIMGKRKESESIPVSSTPKLFSSRFKVPKLKSPSPCTSTT